MRLMSDDRVCSSSVLLSKPAIACYVEKGKEAERGRRETARETER